MNRVGYGRCPADIHGDTGQHAAVVCDGLDGSNQGRGGIVCLDERAGDQAAAEIDFRNVHVGVERGKGVLKGRIVLCRPGFRAEQISVKENEFALLLGSNTAND